MNAHYFPRFAGRLFVAAVLAASAGTLIAADAPMPAASPAAGATGLFGAPTGPNTSQNGDMDLHAFVIEVSIKNGTFTSLNARGKVMMDMKGTRIACDNLKYDPNQQKMVAEVNQTDKVHITGPDKTVTCSHAVYDMKREMYDLTGGVHIKGTDGTTMNTNSYTMWPNGQGKENALGSSSIIDAGAQGIDKNGLKTETALRRDTSINDIKSKLGVSDEEAQKLITNGQTPSEIYASPGGKTQAPSTAAHDGIVTKNNLGSIPGAGTGLATEQ